MEVEPFQRKLGRVIRFHRENRGYSQESFADHIDIHRTYYGAVERGRQNLTLRVLLKIAQGLDMQPSQILHEAETRGENELPAPRGPGRPKGSVGR